MSRRSQQRGFTLVEILVALAIGLFLTAGMVQMYVSNKQTYRFTEALSRMQENGRYALELMAKDMRMADFWGCSRGDNIANHVNTSSSPPYNADLHAFAIRLEGSDGASATPDNPDEITLRGAVGNGFIVQVHNTAGDPITVPGSPTAVETSICGYPGCINNQVADMVLVSDCKGGDIFQATNLDASGSDTDVGFNDTPATNTPGNVASTVLSNAYDQTATLHSLKVATYCVNDGSGCANPGVIEDRGLYLVENGTSREVVEGVANMQITYGEDADGDGTADRYVSAASVIDMDAVVSVRIMLLLASSEDGLTDQAQQVTFNGQTFTAGDRRIHQVLTATFALRNRVL